MNVNNSTSDNSVKYYSTTESRQWRKLLPIKLYDCEVFYCKQQLTTSVSGFRCGVVQLQVFVDDTSYFGKTVVLMHVAVIYTHAVLEYDTQYENSIVVGVVFTISTDPTHDHYFVSEVQSQIKQHLSYIGCVDETMVEYTDGCSSVYKSRTCMRGLTLICQRLGSNKFFSGLFRDELRKGPTWRGGRNAKTTIWLQLWKGV